MCRCLHRIYIAVVAADPAKHTIRPTADFGLTLP